MAKQPNWLHEIIVDKVTRGTHPQSTESYISAVRDALKKGPPVYIGYNLLLLDICIADGVKPSQLCYGDEPYDWERKT